MYHNAIVAVVAIALFGSIAAPAPKLKDGPGGVPYFPARVGMQWVYDQDGREMVIEVTGVKSEAGKTVVTTSRQPAGSVAGTYLITPDAVLDGGNPRFVYDPPLQKLKLPLSPGDSWNYKEPLLDGLRSHTGKMTVGKEETVEVPAGKFAAVPVVFEVTAVQGKPLAQPETYTSWYAREVGFVKMTFPSGGRVLKSFTPGPAKK